MNYSKQIGIIGVGPIGSILGAHLAKNGHHLILVDILKDHLNTIKNQGLIISGLKEMQVKIKDVYTSILELKRFSIDYLFICIKTPILSIILPHIKEIISEKTFVISFQNGLDTEKVIADIVGPTRTLRAVINYAGNFIQNGHIKMTFFNKPNYIGSIVSETKQIAHEIAHIMTQAELDTEAVDDIKKYVWEKVILNAALSPLCALTGQTMKQAMDFPLTYQLIEKILQEGIIVAKSMGYEFGEGFLKHCINYLQNAGHHKTSMHVDIENQRPTEIDFLNKKIVDYGKSKDIPTPYNETIVNLIKAIEQRFT